MDFEYAKACFNYVISVSFIAAVYTTGLKVKEKKRVPYRSLQLSTAKSLGSIKSNLRSTL